MIVMKSCKILLILMLSYVLLIVLFESLLGYFQPENASTLQISTLDDEGKTSSRIVVRIESLGKLYVAANHWPRAWFSDALANPSVQVVSEAEQGRYLAVPILGAEHDRVNEDNSLGLTFRILTGFPPRYFLRLDRAD